MAKIIGLPQLELKLEGMASTTIKDALELSAGLVEATAKENCRQFKHPTGELMNSIDSRWESADAISVFAGVEYAPYVEFGTGIYAGTDPVYGKQYEGTGRNTPWVYPVPGGYQAIDEHGNAYTAYWVTTVGQRPQPFLEPALDSNREAILELFGDAIARRIES